MVIHTRQSFLRIFTLSVLVLLISHANAIAGAITITDVWAASTSDLKKPGGIFLTLSNTGNEADTLVSMTTAAAKVSQLHNVKMKRGKEKMRRMTQLELAPGETKSLVPGGLHIMLMRFQKPLIAGDEFSLTLEFKKAGTLTVPVKVKDHKMKMN